MFFSENYKQNIKKLFRIMPSGIIILFVIGGLTYLLSYYLNFKIPLYQKLLIDNAIEYKSIHNEYLYKIILIYLLFFISENVTNLILNKTKLKADKFLTIRFFDKILKLNKNKIIRNGTGYYYNILSSDVEIVTNLFNIEIFKFFYSIIRTGFILFLLYKWSLAIFWDVIISFIVIIALSWVYSHYNKIFLQKARETASVLSGETVDYFSNNLIIKLFLSLNKIKTNFIKTFSKNYQVKRKMFNFNTSMTTVMEMIHSVSYLLMLIFSLNLIIKGQISYGTLIAIISYFSFAFSPIQNYFGLINLYGQTEISLSRLANIENEIEQKQKNKVIIINKIKQLSFNNIQFYYEENAKKYTDINFVVKNQTRLGIVGLSGEGKTSIIRLLIREILPKKGDILLNDTSIYDLPLLLYYSKINFYSQDMEIFNKDLLYNITIGKEIIPKDEKDIKLHNYKNYYQNLKEKLQVIVQENGTIKNKIKKIKKLLSENNPENEIFTFLDIKKEEIDFNLLKDFLNDDNFTEICADMMFSINFVIKEKLDWIIKKLNLSSLQNRNLGENGAFISGGEKQKVAFARFLLKEGYEFFILDEPFTNLDAITEKQLLDAATELLKDRTGIVISHKFNILHKLTNKIIVLEEGKISGIGTHIELLETNPLYKKIFEEYIKQKEL